MSRQKLQDNFYNFYIIIIIILLLVLLLLLLLLLSRSVMRQCRKTGKLTVLIIVGTICLSVRKVFDHSATYYNLYSL